MRHAYLIMAHNKFAQLSELLRCLDDKDNDIFLHIDAKAPFSENMLTYKPQLSKLYYAERVKVNWGGASQIFAEFNLIKVAVKVCNYDYLHLITGMDLPLKSQQEIHDFFEKYNGKQFICFESSVPESVLERIKFYYPFQEVYDRNNKIGNGLRKMTSVVQRMGGISRLPKDYEVGFGSAYFDITGTFASYLLRREDQIIKMYSKTFCADEIFLQTEYLHSPFNTGTGRYLYDGESGWVPSAYMDIVRAVDWKRGSPYTYTEEDYESLLKSGCMFGRKFDLETHPDLFKKVVQYVTMKK